MTKGKLLIEIEKGLEDRKITRLDLLKLVGIDYCLECRGYYYEERTAEGYCFYCEKEWQKNLRAEERGWERVCGVNGEELWIDRDNNLVENK